MAGVVRLGASMFTDHATLDLFLRAIILGPLSLIWVNVVVRVIGLRTFSKMTAVDFVSTVATGSLLANAATATSWPAFVQATLSMSSVLGLQYVIARVRRSDRNDLQDAMENSPLVLFKNGEFCRAAMKQARVTEDDLWAKMREANVLNRSEVSAIVLETTGDVSVLHGGEADDEILSGVKTA